MSLRRKRTTTATIEGVDCPLCRRVVPLGEDADRCVLGHPLPAAATSVVGEDVDPLTAESTEAALDDLHHPPVEMVVESPVIDPYAQLAEPVGPFTAEEQALSAVDPYAELADPYSALLGDDPFASASPSTAPAQAAAQPTTDTPDTTEIHDELSALELLARGESPFEAPRSAPQASMALPQPPPSIHPDGLRLPLPPGTPAPLHTGGVEASGLGFGGAFDDTDPHAHPLDGLLGSDSPFAGTSAGTATALEVRPAEPLTEMLTFDGLTAMAAPTATAAHPPEGRAEPDPTVAHQTGVASEATPGGALDGELDDLAFTEDEALDDAVALFAAPDDGGEDDEDAEDARHARRRLLGIIAGALTTAAAVGGAAAAWFLI